MFTALASVLTPVLADTYYYWGGGGLGLILVIVVVVLLLRRRWAQDNHWLSDAQLEEAVLALAGGHVQQVDTAEAGSRWVDLAGTDRWLCAQSAWLRPPHSRPWL
jgi:hypothetical protein